LRAESNGGTLDPLAATRPTQTHRQGWRTVPSRSILEESYDRFYVYYEKE